MIWDSSAFQKRTAALHGPPLCRLLRAALLAAGSVAALGAGAARAETIGGALVKAYLTNPDINTQRAAVRVADEGVPKANAGYLPTVTATGSMAVERGKANAILPNGGGTEPVPFTAYPRGYGVQANETV